MTGSHTLYRRILVPTDFSDHSARVVEHAVALGRAVGAELVLFHAYERPALAGIMAGDAALRAYLDRGFQESTDRLESVAQGLEGVRCRAISTQGRAWIEILAVADRENCDLIVMGSHARTHLADVLVGDVTEKVLHRARCPVLILRPEGAGWPDEREAD